MAQSGVRGVMQAWSLSSCRPQLIWNSRAVPGGCYSPKIPGMRSVQCLRIYWSHLIILSNPSHIPVAIPAHPSAPGASLSSQGVLTAPHLLLRSSVTPGTLMAFVFIADLIWS